MTAVPSSRLIGWTAACVPIAAVAGPLPGLGSMWILLLGGIAVAALADLLTSLRTLAWPELIVPGVIRLSKDRKGTVPIVVKRPAGGPDRVRLAVAWPDGIDGGAAERWVEWTPGAPSTATVEWNCTARRRGRFAVGRVGFEQPSRLGFWQVRMSRESGAEARVYPNLFSERRQLAALFLNRAMLGSKLRRTVGRGREFEKLRDYLPGDGIDEVHWKATAKRGHPITKMFQVERTQEVYVILDASRLSGRRLEHDGLEVTALERQLTATLVLLLAAERQGDRFGLVAHSNRVVKFLRAGNGATHFGACREAVHALRTEEVSPDFRELFTFLRLRLRQRALLFFLTDLSDPVQAEDFAEHVRLLSRQHLVMVGQLRPPGTRAVFDAGDVSSADEVYERLGGHLLWREARDLADTLKRRGATATLLENETLAAQLVTQYLQIKQRQAL